MGKIYSNLFSIRNIIKPELESQYQVSKSWNAYYCVGNACLKNLHKTLKRLHVTVYKSRHEKRSMVWLTPPTNPAE
jgi:hypothetical protein